MGFLDKIKLSIGTRSEKETLEKAKLDADLNKVAQKDATQSNDKMQASQGSILVPKKTENEDKTPIKKELPKKENFELSTTKDTKETGNASKNDKRPVVASSENIQKSDSIEKLKQIRKEKEEISNQLGKLTSEIDGIISKLEKDLDSIEKDDKQAKDKSVKEKKNQEKTINDKKKSKDATCQNRPKTKLSKK